MAENGTANGSHGIIGRWTPDQLLKKPNVKVDPMDWGMPGSLTQEELNCFVKFQTEVEKRGGEFRNTVYSFGEIEGEAHCLCRWLRARKFDYEKVIAMIEEASDVRKDGLKADFYPDPKKALGVDPSIYISQYPQLYTGFAKTGAPLFVSKPGSLEVDGIECITTLDNILKYHWYAMMHDFKDRLQAKKKEEGDNFVRFECVIILDLENLTASKLTSRTLNIIKIQSAIDSICFPETLGRMVIVNAPRYFTVTWKLIKSWLDPRTAGKVDVMSSRSTWEKRLLEFIDVDQLPSDYGGKAEDTRKTLLSQAPGGMVRQVTELMSFRSHSSFTFTLNPNEEVEILIFTKFTVPATFTVVDGDKKVDRTYVPATSVKHLGEEDPKVVPTATDITKSGRISGPASLKIRGETSGYKKNYLVVCNFFPKK